MSTHPDRAAIIAGAEADSAFFTGFLTCRGSLRPVSPLETAALLARKGVKPLPGVKAPHIYAVMHARLHNGLAIKRRLWKVTKRVWQHRTELAAVGYEPGETGCYVFEQQAEWLIYEDLIPTFESLENYSRLMAPGSCGGPDCFDAPPPPTPCVPGFDAPSGGRHA